MNQYFLLMVATVENTDIVFCLSRLKASFTGNLALCVQNLWPRGICKGSKKWRWQLRLWDQRPATLTYVPCNADLKEVHVFEYAVTVAIFTFFTHTYTRTYNLWMSLEQHMQTLICNGHSCCKHFVHFQSISQLLCVLNCSIQSHFCSADRKLLATYVTYSKAFKQNNSTISVNSQFKEIRRKVELFHHKDSLGPQCVFYEQHILVAIKYIVYVDPSNMCSTIVRVSP